MNPAIAYEKDELSGVSRLALKTKMGVSPEMNSEIPTRLIAAEKVEHRVHIS